MARIALPLAEGFDVPELSGAVARLREAGHEVVLLGDKAGRGVCGAGGEAWPLDQAVAEARPEQFDALVLIGGGSADVRTDAEVVELVRRIHAARRPIAAIGLGPRVLIDAGLVDGVTVAASPPLRADLVDAGASWVDQALIEYGELITARTADDLEPFCTALLRRL